jgi:MFS family permease
VTTPTGTASPAPAGILAGPRRALTIGLILVVTAAAFEALAVATVMPAAEEALGGLSLYGWTFSAYLLASLVGIAAAGEQSDAHGPARPFLAGIVLFAIGLAIAGLAPSMPVLVAGRAVQGLGGGVIPAVAYVAIGRGYDESLRPRMFAVLATVWVLPGLIGPALAGVVADYATWRLVFLGLLPLLAVATVLTLPGLRELGRPETPLPGERQVPRAIVLAAGTAIAFAGAGSSIMLIGMPVAVIGAAIAFVALLQLMPSGTMRASPGLPAAIAGMGLLNMAFFGTESFVPLMLTRVRDQSAVLAGVTLTTATLTWTTGAWVQERTAGRWRRAPVVRWGFALVAVGIGCMALVVWGRTPVWFAAVAWAIAGGGIGMAYASISLIALSASPQGGEGAASASLKVGETLSAAVGAGAGGVLIAAGGNGGWLAGSILATFGTMAAVAVLGALVSPRLGTTTLAPHRGEASVATPSPLA